MKSKFSFSVILSCLLIVALLFGCSLSKLFNKKPKLEKIRADFIREDSKQPGDKDFTKLKEFLEKYTKDNPDDQEGHYYLGYIYDRLGMPNGDKLLEADVTWETKAALEFYYVIKINPEYRGDYYYLSPYSKISSIYGTLAASYVNRKMYKETALAFSEGKKMGGFSEAVLDNARNIFSCCEKDAILFTEGDMDTFPFWYLQYVHKYRRDITVINLSLLNAQWYINQLKEGYLFGENNIKIRFTKQQVEKLSPVEWITKIVSVPVSPKAISKFGITDNDIIKTGKMQWVMPVTIGDETVSAIRVQDVMVREIIESNDWERPVYFRYGVSNYNSIGLGDYFRDCGIVQHLTPNKHKEDTFEIEDMITYKSFFLDHKEGDNIYQTGMKWEGLNEIPDSYDRDVFYIPSSYQNILLNYAYFLYSKKDPVFKSVIKKLEEKFPCDIFIPGYKLYKKFHSIYYKLDLGGLHRYNADKIEKAILNKTENNRGDSRNYPLYQTLLTIYEEKEEYKKGSELLKDLVKLYPNDSIFMAQKSYFTEKENKK